MSSDTPTWDQQQETDQEIAQRRHTLARVAQLIWLATNTLEAFIGVRVLLKLIAANPDAGFARFIYGITSVFLVPFSGLTATPSAGGAALELSSIIAMIVYALLAAGIVRAIWIIFDRRP